MIPWNYFCCQQKQKIRRENGTLVLLNNIEKDTNLRFLIFFFGDSDGSEFLAFILLNSVFMKLQL